MKKLVGALAAFALLGGANVAAGEMQKISFDAAPFEYEAEAISYIETRLTSSLGAKYELLGEPYEARGVIRAGNGKLMEWSGWAQDVRVDARLPGGRNGSAQVYTVVFAGDQAFGLGADFRRLSRL